jgi:EAL domain-containing protein (putative c-di-GMP-specific phosphodiesterase class I)
VLTVSLNLSGRQLRQQDLRDDVSKALQLAALPPSLLRLEVTEKVVMENGSQTDASVCGLRALGVHVDIDDFGVGATSLDVLRRFSADAFKADRSLVADIGVGSSNGDMVRAVLSLAHGLGAKVTAEGVETRQQLEALRRLGCDYAQGFYFSRPLTVEAAGLLLAQRRSW